MTQAQPKAAQQQAAAKPASGAPTAQVIQLPPPSRWHDPLQLIQNDAPSHIGRIVLWSVSVLVLLLLVWACFGKLDIIATADGKLVPQTLLKIVQPAEAGVIKELLVKEGDTVQAGQVLARLDPTVAAADTAGVANDLQRQQMQARRIQAELSNTPMPAKAGDDRQLYAQVQSQYLAHRQAFTDSLAQEQSLLSKAEYEHKSALNILAKLQQTLPTYEKTANAFATLEQQGFVATIAAAEKQREALEKAKDLDAQRATVSALTATIAAQQKRISQHQSAYRSELQKELADVNAKIAQLQPNLDKSLYRAGLMELRAPQAGVIKDLATTTLGAVVQPGTVILTLVPGNEPLYADVQIKNEDVGFVQVGQTAQIKLAAYPFQKYGMLTGKVVHISADAVEKGNAASNQNATDQSAGSVADMAYYKARVQLDQQLLTGPRGTTLPTTAGMQVVAEIHQGRRTVMEYLLSPVRKVTSEAVRER